MKRLKSALQWPHLLGATFFTLMCKNFDKLTLHFLCKIFYMGSSFLAVWFKNSVLAKLPHCPAKRVPHHPVGLGCDAAGLGREAAG